MLKKVLIGLAVFFVGVVAFYGTHYYFFNQRVQAALAADPEYQRILEQERQANEKKAGP